VNDNQWLRFGPILGCGGLSGNEFDIIVEADDFPTCVGFYVPLGNLTRFIIEETMRVTAPGHTPHVNPRKSSMHCNNE
jgi:hypothetical protein